MGSSTAPRNYASVNGEDGEDFGVEVMETNSAILMSLMEELQEEDRDDERLNSMIQSLEAEIANPSTMDGSGSSAMDSELIIKDAEDGALGNFDCSISHDWELGCFGRDEQVACSPCSDDMNWYIDSCEYDMDCPTDSGIWVSDYSHIWYGVGLEEEHVYSSLWQDTAYDSIMYDQAKDC